MIEQQAQTETEEQAQTPTTDGAEAPNITDEASALEQALGADFQEVVTNKRTIRLEEFDLWGCARAMRILGRLQSKGQVLQLAGTNPQQRQMQFGKMLLEGGEDMLELIALSAGFLTEETAKDGSWRTWHQGIKSRFMLPLIMAAYEMNTSFFEDLMSTLFMVQNAEAQMGQVAQAVVEAALNFTGKPDGKAPLPGGEFSLADLQAMATPRPKSAASN